MKVQKKKHPPNRSVSAQRARFCADCESVHFLESKDLVLKGDGGCLSRKNRLTWFTFFVMLKEGIYI